MTTLTEVAAAAGVSTATVSHVINSTRYVSPTTIQKVQDAIARTGYRPNPYARALRTASTESIGFVASDISNPYSTAVMRGIAAALRDANHIMLVADANDDPALERDAIDALVHRKVDGLIIAPTTAVNAVTLEQIEDVGVPVVLIDRAIPLPLDQVLVENIESVESLVGEMLDAGHSRVGVIAGRRDHSTTTERLAGWRLAHERRGRPVDETLVVVGATNSEQARTATAALLDRADRPTAIFATSNVESLGALRAFKAAGLAIPRDLSFAAFDDVEWADLLDAPLTCLAQPTTEIGREAVGLLLRRLTDPAVEHRTVRLAPELRNRGSIQGAPEVPTTGQ
jgi:LacI family transcriptional regulator